MLFLESLPQWVVYLLVVYVSLPLVVYYVVPFLTVGNKSIKKTVIVYVLGDIGHSPRICYHARSFSERGFQVELCGYVDSDVPDFILEDHNITVHGLPRLNRCGMVKKVGLQVFYIVKHLWELRGSDYILMQNPPSIPIMPIVALYRLLTGCKFIIDWHNLAYSILRLKYHGNSYHPLVIVSLLIEFIFCRFADYHFTVTLAMRDFLIKRFKLSDKRCFVLYDRPATQFTPFDSETKSEDAGHQRQRQRHKRMDAILHEPFLKGLIPDAFDVTKGDKIIVTSTSFTPDEDIGILLGALKIYENSYLKFDDKLPRVLCFITGKGPLKKAVMEQVGRDEDIWNRVHIEFVWLSAEDYPKLLRLCDYGVSLHSSSSGLDLPMKILDMFGSGLPVIALNYPVLDELVKHDVNGLKFLDRRELHESLIFAMKDSKIYDTLKAGAMIESRNRWQTSWERAMKEARIIH